MSEYSVQRAGVLTAIEEIRATTKKIDTDLNTLESQAEAHLAEWIGSAREAYKVEKKNWDDAIVGMNGVLELAGRTLDDILFNYDDTEKRARDAWGA